MEAQRYSPVGEEEKGGGKKGRGEKVGRVASTGRGDDRACWVILTSTRPPTPCADCRKGRIRTTVYQYFDILIHTTSTLHRDVHLLLKPAAVHIADFCVKTPLRFGLAGGCGGGASGPGSVAGAGTGIGAVPVGGGGGSSGRVSCGEGELLSASLEVEVHLVGGGGGDLLLCSAASLVEVEVPWWRSCTWWGGVMGRPGGERWRCTWWVVRGRGGRECDKTEFSYDAQLRPPKLSHTPCDREGLFCCVALLPFITAAIRCLSPRRPQLRNTTSPSFALFSPTALPAAPHHAGHSVGARPLPRPCRAPPGRPRWPTRYGPRYGSGTARTGIPGGHVVRPRHGRDQGR